MLSSFVAAVYALQGAGRFCISVGFALRPIVAESLWTQAKVEKSGSTEGCLACFANPTTPSTKR
jgi:hypothetical protein